MIAADLYEQDFYEWTVRNAELLRSGRISEADLEHIADEVEAMGRRERRELLSRLAVLIAYLLKWQVQPERRSRSWTLTINVQRRELKKLLAEMPSLRRFLEKRLSDAYEEAVMIAAAETNLPPEAFTNTCGYEVEALLDEEFLP